MSEEIKFEPLFGDQSLFDTAKDRHVFACKKDNGDVYFHDHSILSAGGVTIYGYIAMRRIIKTPVWTVADQKAGRLPEIGDKHRFDGLTGKFICRFVDFKGDIWSSSELGELYSSGDYEALPIETPDEKAQRLEEEFIDSIMREHPEISHPMSFKVGVRVAYRKTLELKAPEVE